MKEILRSEALTKYFGGLCAVSQVNFSMKKGSILGLIGPNGAGKTTLINLISGSLQPSSGRIFFNNQDISKLKSHATNNLGIARTFQVVRIFSRLTTLENVLVALVDRRRKGPWRLVRDAIFGRSRPLIKDREACKRADKLLGFVGIIKYRDELAENLPYALTKRLEIARALATQPELLLLDEPSSGLNPAELVDQIDLIKQINQQGITILIVEHVMKVIMDISHELIVLHYGEKIAEGTPEEVYTNPDVIEAYLGDETDAVP
jgi:ABC-type branched-subunit amino acid transport system ATPase component